MTTCLAMCVGVWILTLPCRDPKMFSALRICHPSVEWESCDDLTNSTRAVLKLAGAKHVKSGAEQLSPCGQAFTAEAQGKGCDPARQRTDSGA